ncbi:MAG TPA: ABC transporter permease [Acetobacteraceae bacterium]|nr:ABC transporter permease [Acetobacteraceae bacterium]
MSGRALAWTTHWSLRIAAAVGRAVRVRAQFLLMLAALAWGVLREACYPRNWRRSVRAEFRRTLHQAAGGGLATTLVTAALTGLAMVSQALYWLGLAGQEELAGPILVTVLVRELTPLLIGLVLLGRSGTVTIAELGLMRAGAQMRSLVGQGIDPFLLLVLPRALAFALAAFTLGMLFATSALVVGFITGSLLGAVQGSLFLFFDHVLAAMRSVDFAMFPLKMVSIGFLVALTTCLTGLTARANDDTASLLPRGFVRGVLAIMITSLLFSAVA